MKKLLAIISLGLLMGITTIVQADDVTKAYAVCNAMDGTGLLSEPCEVSGYSGAVDVSMDTSGGEARKMCQGVNTLLRQNNIYFTERQWKMRIYSPFSDGNTLAVCNLPTKL